MNKQSKAMIGAIGGAVVGGVVGYLCFTEHGRSLRRRLEPALEDLGHEFTSLRGTIEKAVRVANRGWSLINDTGWSPSHEPATRWSSHH